METSTGRAGNGRRIALASLVVLAIATSCTQAHDGTGDGGGPEATVEATAPPENPSTSNPAPDRDAERAASETVGPPATDTSNTEFSPPDPGVAMWDLVAIDDVAEICGLDPEMLIRAGQALDGSYGVVRHGRLCYEHASPGSTAVDEASPVWSATKTLTAVVLGIAAYQTRDISETGPQTGPLSPTGRVDHWLEADAITYNPNARIEHVLGMVAFNDDLDGPLQFAYDSKGTREIQSLATMVETAIAQDPDRLGTQLEDFAAEFLFDPLGMEDSQWGGDSDPPPTAFGWNTTLRDMARFGLLIHNGGVWNGERLLDEAYIDAMTHPSFPAANANYGYLTWLGASCSPPLDHDAVVWKAAGAGGNFVMGHPGLDLVIVSKDLFPLREGIRGFSSQLWDTIRPAVVAHDPKFAGDEDAFCMAYGGATHLPSLVDS